MSTTDPQTLSAAHRAFLEARRIAVVATAGEDSSPHQATVWFRLDPDDRIMLNGRVERRWAKELRRTGRMSIAVLYPDGSSWLGLATELETVDDDPVRGLEGIMALHRLNHDGQAGPDAEATYATHPRVTVRVRVTGVHDHLGSD